MRCSLDLELFHVVRIYELHLKTGSITVHHGCVQDQP